MKRGSELAVRRCSRALLKLPTPQFWGRVEVGVKGSAECFFFAAFEAGVSLKTGGFYRVVRNPLYLSDVLWCFGWAMIFRSKIGIALVPVWWAGLWLLTIIEEESLERKLNRPYLEYQRQVRGRIIPGLPL
jgi:protein-S-isoprenylcysteine O-methyltransferase Ste14